MQISGGALLWLGLHAVPVDFEFMGPKSSEEAKRTVGERLFGKVLTFRAETRTSRLVIPHPAVQMAMDLFACIRSVFSPVPPPTGPVSFGYKTAWIAVRATDPAVVLAALPLQLKRRATWGDGLSAAYEQKGVFITPPIDGWICIIGEFAFGTGNGMPVADFVKIITDLSLQFSEVRAFASHRVVEYHHWVWATEGRLVRGFSYLGESGVTWEDGEVTQAERSLSYGGQPVGEWMPDEQDVMTMAGEWCFDPTRLTAESGTTAFGILAG